MADQEYEPTDPGRWIDDRGPVPSSPSAAYERSHDDAETLRQAFHEDRYGEGTDNMFANVRAQRFRRAVVAAALALAVLLIAILALNGGDDTTTDDDTTADDATDTTADSDVATDPGTESEPDVDDDIGDDVDDPVDPPGVATGTSGDPALDQILLAAGIDPGDERIRSQVDALRDIFDSIRANSASLVRGDVDIAKVIEILLRMSSSEVSRVFNQSTIECGANEPILVVCPNGVTDMVEGDVLVLGMTLDAPVPSGDTGHSFIYSAVFDSDGDAANDWVFNPPFDFDLFQGADRWYQLQWSHTTQSWSLSVSQVDADQTIRAVESSVRVAVSGNNVVFFVPRSEVGDGAYRLTSFGHDGAFSESDRGADVSGVDPTVPLTVPTAEPIETAPQ